ncbi:Pathogenesis-related transcriptional factor and ERF protein [Lelliottia amnigena]|uniref:HNH endonuclease n=1 Tax=Lelliottia amnigena TaxID=61646 RepID=UPI001039B7B2|nr:HNH endonuclease [Lelliottia amnigena]TCD25011.1 Pathogenesis-related transcriptional factor and ERF protein [Lelliottia amnigena]
MNSGTDKMMQCDEFKGITYNKHTGQFFGTKTTNPVGRMHNKGYWRITHANKCYLAHRLAWFFCYGVWPKEIDHIDNDKLNNSICNLREVTHQLNQLNMPLRSNNTSGVKGVNWDKQRKRWRARVVVNGKYFTAGHFKEIADAELAIRNLRERVHGEFANHGRKL